METYNIPLGPCPTCKDTMITENGIPKCLNCSKPARPKHIVKPPPVTEIPNPDEFNKYIKGTAEVTHLPDIRQEIAAVSGKTAKDALEIMRHLEMPDSEKEFRQIKKIIKQLEKLVGENS